MSGSSERDRVRDQRRSPLAIGPKSQTCRRVDSRRAIEAHVVQRAPSREGPARGESECVLESPRSPASSRRFAVGLASSLRQFVTDRFGLLFGAVGSIRSAREPVNDCAINDAIEQGHRQRWIAEIVGPVFKVDIGYQRRRTSTAATVDDFVE